MLIHITALFSGLIFGTGLILSGMVNPAKVLAFLDITGQWDPSLALVMAGICPGPGLVLAASGHFGAIIFVASMLLGMMIFDVLEKHRSTGSVLNRPWGKNSSQTERDGKEENQS